SYDRIENKYGEIENNSDLEFEKKIEDELDEPDTKYEKDTEDELGIEFNIVSESEPDTEHKKDTKNRPGIEFEEDINIQTIEATGVQPSTFIIDANPSLE
ncbi:30264_t:CDS:2, partial [Racocetra persica]